jgi:hypothetical protein
VTSPLVWKPSALAAISYTGTRTVQDNVLLQNAVPLVDRLQITHRREPGLAHA